MSITYITWHHSAWTDILYFQVTEMIICRFNPFSSQQYHITWSTNLLADISNQIMIKSYYLHLGFTFTVCVGSQRHGKIFQLSWIWAGLRVGVLYSVIMSDLKSSVLSHWSAIHREVLERGWFLGQSLEILYSYVQLTLTSSLDSFVLSKRTCILLDDV